MQQLLSLLSDSLSADPARRIPSQHSLTSLTFNQAQDLLPPLLDIVADESIPVEIRTASIVFFKNFLDLNIRKIPKSVRADVRSRLLIFPTLESSLPISISKLLAISIGKLVRMDYGDNWPTLPNDLISSIKVSFSNPNPLKSRHFTHRSLLYTHSSIKALQSNRLMKGKILMIEMNSFLFQDLLQLYFLILNRAIETAQVVNNGDSSSREESDDFDLALLLFKTLTKLYPLADDSQRENVNTFLSTLVTNLNTLISHQSTLQSTQQSIGNGSTTGALHKLILSHGKLFRNLIKDTTTVSISLLPSILATYWNLTQQISQCDISDLDELKEKLLIQSLLLIDSITGSWSSQSPVKIDESNLFEILLKLLILSPVEIEEFIEEPENSFLEEEADRTEYNIRACASMVLSNLMIREKETLAQKLSDLLSQAVDSKAEKSILQKEAIYFAAAKSASAISTLLDIPNLLNSLAKESSSNPLIISRRICSVLGAFLEEDLPVECRVMIYDHLTTIIARGSDSLGVRLMAARALGKIDTWDFETTSFVPFLEISISGLLSVISIVTENIESKMVLTKTLGTVIDRVGSNIEPYVPILLEFITYSWTQNEEEDFYLTSLLVLITKLAEAVSHASHQLLSTASIIIYQSIDPSSQKNIFLLEDALELWQVLLKKAATLSQEFIELIPSLIQLLSEATDSLPRILRLLESYTLLDPLVTLSYSSIFPAFDVLLVDLTREQSIKGILNSINLLFTSTPLSITSLLSSTLFSRLLSPILTELDHFPATIIIRYLFTLSRIVLASSTEEFYQLLASTGQNVDSLLNIILSCYLEKIDNMVGRDMKLTALAVVSLLCFPSTVISTRIAEILNLLNASLSQTEEDSNGNADIYGSEDQEFDYVETLESVRRASSLSRDPIHSTVLKTCVLTTIQLQLSRDEGFKQSLNSIDPLILSELANRVEGRLAG